MTQPVVESAATLAKSVPDASISSFYTKEFWRATKRLCPLGVELSFTGWSYLLRKAERQSQAGLERA